ncbi:hypothetical protein D6D00_10402, partial [Aureobasidium pullulans]
ARLGSDIPQLRHAICALSCLSLALRGRRTLFVKAFQHYDSAISACISNGDAEASLLFHFHFVLLIYDICYITQSTPGPSMWSQHLRHLERLARRLQRPITNGIEANMLWFVLCLDTQSCLAGNRDAGSYVRAYLANAFVLPCLTQLECSRVEYESGNHSSAAFAVCGLAAYICRKLAELSQLALQMRKEENERRGSTPARQRCIDNFHHVLYSEWTIRYESMLVHASSQSGVNFDKPTSTILEFYLTSMIYLHTSMYPRQRIKSPDIRRQVAQHYADVLSIASLRGSGQSHIFFPLFLTGYASKCAREKLRALELMEDLQVMSLSDNCTRLVYLLQLIHGEQKAELDSSGETELDWIECASRMGIKIVNFNL